MRWAVLWSLVILVLTLMPGNDVPAWSWAEAVHFDKIVHAGLFGVQTILLGCAWTDRSATKERSVRPYLLAVLAAIAYGVAIELLQGAMDMGRSADITDAMADGAGALLGYGLLRWRPWSRA